MKTAIFLLAFQTCFANFSYDLSKEIGSQDENWIFSPYSVSSCLGMVKDGAAGDTEEELAACLPSGAEPIHYRGLKSVQSAWVKEEFPLLDSYASLLEERYGASAERVPFNAATLDKINSWVADVTRGKIRDLLSPSDITPSTRLVLANALYFLGDWISPFNPNKTQSLPFHVSPTQSVDAPTMEQVGSFSYFENSELKALSLPFKPDSDSACEPICLLLLPKDETQEILSSDSVKEILSNMQRKMVRVQVPKFTIEQKCSLKDPLKRLGIQKVFDARLSDLSRIDGRHDLYLSTVVHKAFFAFEEKGVEAAAATGAVAGCTAVHPRPPLYQFVADRPFYFVLLDKRSETILFMGYLKHPCAS
jgi:serpin B